MQFSHIFPFHAAVVCFRILALWNVFPRGLFMPEARLRVSGRAVGIVCLLLYCASSFLFLNSTSGLPLRTIAIV